MLIMTHKTWLILSDLSFQNFSTFSEFVDLSSKKKYINFISSSPTTRALILSAYIKMINLFPEIKADIEDVLRSDVLLKNSDIELQQRALEYFKVFLEKKFWIPQMV